MHSQISAISDISKIIMIIVLVILAVMCFLCLIRSVKGPRIADRVVAINMLNTMVMVMIAILTVMLKEGFLADVGLIYSVIGFLSVVVLCKVYVGVYLEKRKKEDTEENNHDHN